VNVTPLRQVPLHWIPLSLELPTEVMARRWHTPEKGAEPAGLVAVCTRLPSPTLMKTDQPSPTPSAFESVSNPPFMPSSDAGHGLDEFSTTTPVLTARASLGAGRSR
jgi:hypothetical protein